MTIAELVARLSVDSTGFDSGLQGAQSKLKASTVAMGNIMSGLITKGAKMFASIVKTGADFNAEIESMQVAFATMTGSTEKAAEMVERLKKMGAETPFETGDLVKTTQLLMQYGFTADDAIAKMSMLGDISQGNAQAMTSIATGYAQMSSAGKVNLQDIKQMINGGFNPLQEITERTGESMESLYKRISKGTMSVSEITASMEAATSEGGKYYNSMVNQSKTMSGQISTLKDNWKNLTGGIIEPFTAKLTDTILPKLNEKIGELTGALFGVDEVGTNLPDTSDVAEKLQTWLSDLWTEWNNGLAEDDTTVDQYVTSFNEQSGKIAAALQGRLAALTGGGNTFEDRQEMQYIQQKLARLAAINKQIEEILSANKGKNMSEEDWGQIQALQAEAAALSEITTAAGSLSEESVGTWGRFADALARLAEPALEKAMDFIISLTDGSLKQKIESAISELVPEPDYSDQPGEADKTEEAQFDEKHGKTRSDFYDFSVSRDMETLKNSGLEDAFLKHSLDLEDASTKYSLVAEALKEGGEGGAENALESYGFSPEEIDQVVAKMEELGAAEQLTNKEAFTLMTGIEGLSNEFASLPSPDELDTLSTGIEGLTAEFDTLPPPEGLDTLSTGIKGLTAEFDTLPSPEGLGLIASFTSSAATAASEIDGSGMDSLASSASTAESNVSDLNSELSKALSYDGKSINISVNTSGGGGKVLKGKWETGLGYVPYNNYATTLDEGEMVLTKAQAERYRRGEKDGAVGGGSIDYDRLGATVARALSGFGIDINGKRAANLMQKNTCAAQNTYAKSYALGVGK